MSKAAGSRYINAKTIDIVIYAAGDRGKRDALNRRPLDAVCWGGHCQVIAMAKRLKTAVYPDEIHFARTVDAGAEENVTIIISIFSIRNNAGNE